MRRCSDKNGTKKDKSISHNEKKIRDRNTVGTYPDIHSRTQTEFCQLQKIRGKIPEVYRPCRDREMMLCARLATLRGNGAVLLLVTFHQVSAARQMILAGGMARRQT